MKKIKILSFPRKIISFAPNLLITRTLKEPLPQIELLLKRITLKAVERLQVLPLNIELF